MNGAKLAVEDVNAKGGVLGKKLSLEVQDDAGDPKKTVSAFQFLTDVKKVPFIIGPSWSNQGLPLIELAKKKKTVIISPSLGVGTFNEANEFLYTLWPHDYILSEKLAEFVFAKGHRRVALIGAEHVWVKEQTEAFRKKFESLGGVIAFLSEPSPGSTDLRSDALKIKSLKVDAFVSTTDGVHVGSLVAKALKEIGVVIPMYSITLDQQAIDASHGGFDGLEYLTFLTPTEEFQKRYEEVYKTSIDAGADTAYDAVMMLTKAMKETNSADAEVVTKYLNQLRSYSGVSGELESDGKRSFVKPFAIKKIKGATPHEFKP